MVYKLTNGTSQHLLGTNLVKCARSGFTILSSEARREWDGKIVDAKLYREQQFPYIPLDMDDAGGPVEFYQWWDDTD